MACDTLPAYPDFNEIFKILTDASAFELGPVLKNKDKPIAFYSRKLTDSQQWYTVADKELISIVETLKKFQTILLYQKLIICTDHKNPTSKN